MSPQPDLHARVAALSANLSPQNREDNEALLKLERLLVRSRITDSAAQPVPKELSVERASWYAAENLPPDRQQRLGRLIAEADPQQQPQYRVFRREAPVTAPALDLATPAWGRGAAIEQTVGPFKGLDGRQFWFDFYPVVRLVPIYLAGDPHPALLVHLHQLGLRLSDPFPLQRILELLRNRRIELAPGSVWMRADLLANGAPAGGYAGLRIDGGQLVFAPRPIEANGRLTIPAGGRCTMSLNLSPPAVPAAGPGKAGIDAAKAELTLPASVSFRLEAGNTTVTQLANAHWKLYGQAVDFAWAKTAAPAYEPLLQSVLVPLAASVKTLKVDKAGSPFTHLAAEAAIARAGWALPVAMIDVNAPTEAAGNGGLAVHAKDGLTLGWRGLREGPVRLRAPWVSLWPGLIFIIDPLASNRFARQRFRLWKDASSSFRSELDVSYTDAFLVSYAAAASGSELLLAVADADARLDRPVDVTGTPFPVHTRGSRLVLTYTDAKQWAFFYDDNILVDSLDPHATWPVNPGQAISLAIRNALFTITPVNSLLLFAELRDEETVDKAILLLGMGLYGLLPTLPDPYAANVAWLRRLGRGDQRVRQASMLLVASVGWTKAANDKDPDNVDASFAFAPLGTQEQTVAVWSEAANEVVANVQAALTPPNAGAGRPPPAAQLAMMAAAPAGQSDEAIWNRYFQGFEQEQFALLDVSTNADQMGVSFAWFNARAADDRNYTFYRVYAPKGAEAAAPAFPLQVRELDLSAQSRFVRAFTVPQMSWEPLFNLTNPEPPPPPPIEPDPPVWWNLYPNDGGPTRLFNDSVELVPIAPIPVTDFLIKDFEQRKTGFTGALFTLPFGLKTFAEFSRQNQFRADLLPAKLAPNRPKFTAAEVQGGLQLRVDAPQHPDDSPVFQGSTMQLNNVLWHDGTPSNAGTLGGDVGYIFNNEFFFDAPTAYKPRGVPLTRIDFCGYGASIFSHWQSPGAAIAATSQAHFDVFVGRTAHEVIQVRSLIYPWGIRVVRTITMFRSSSGYVYRFDTGWQAESDGVYNFNVKGLPPNPYEFHPGIVKGLFRIRNIRENTGLPNFEATVLGDHYLLRPVYFDADVEIDDVTSGAVGGRVPSKGVLGYVQLAPRGKLLPADQFAALLDSQFGAIGGPVECIINIGKSGQLMRLSRIDVNHATAGGPIFVSAARGAVVLPKDGSWSVVQHNQDTGEVTPVDAQAAVPLIRRGRLDSTNQKTDTTPADLFRLANPLDLVPQARPGIRNYGLLQSTGTQKALFRLPSFQQTVDRLLSADPDFADAYRMVNSAGIFPNVHDAQSLTLNTFQTKILAEGYKFVDQIDPAKVFEHALGGPLFLINEKFLRLYVEYGGNLNFGFDATANDMGKRWLSKLNDVTMVVDLGPFTRMMTIKGTFHAQKGVDPAYVEPKLSFGKDLQPIVDILEILQNLQGNDYKAAFQKGLEIAMSNSADSWSYAFHARKEFPLIKFPPGAAYDQPETPLKLECHMAVGVYFNEVLGLTTDPKQLIPSAGAFLEFGGRLSVMCVSLELATVYAVGAVDLRIAADVKAGPSLHMKFGFGAEVVVALPVVANVSLLYMVGVEIDLETKDLSVAAFLLFRGRAEILGGIVTVTIMIEAKGTYHRQLAPPEHTDLIAQVTFGLDVSVFLVVNIHFSQSWQESRQIA